MNLPCHSFLISIYIFLIGAINILAEIEIHVSWTIEGGGRWRCERGIVGAKTRYYCLQKLIEYPPLSSVRGKATPIWLDKGVIPASLASRHPLRITNFCQVHVRFRAQRLREESQGKSLMRIYDRRYFN